MASSSDSAAAAFSLASPLCAPDIPTQYFRFGSFIGPYGIVAGTASTELAQKVAVKLQLQLIPTNIRRFADGEVGVKILENVREKTIFVVQATCPPVNDNLMQLLLLVDALRRASCRRIIAVIPYFGYARQDRKTQPRVPISAALVAKLIESTGVHSVICVDLHCGQIQGFFDRPVDNLYGAVVMVESFVRDHIRSGRVVVVSPDAGGAERADYFRSLLALHGVDADYALMNKTRPRPNEVSHMELIGDVKGGICIIVDDMIDTAGTLCIAAQTLMDAGAAEVHACASHALLSGEAVPRINASVLKRVVVLDTVTSGATASEKIERVSVAPLIADAIEHAANGQSVTQLFGRTASEKM